MNHPPNTRSYAYQLRYAWTAWPQETLPVDLLATSAFQSKLAAAWEPDGIRPLEWHTNTRQIQILFSTRPDISPGLITSRAKGRLQHALRQAGQTTPFQRHFSLNTVGAPDAANVDRYLKDQLKHGDFADPRYRDTLAHLAFSDPGAHLLQPLASKSGRYVLAYHFVFVVSDRWRMPSDTASRIRDGFLNAASQSARKIAKIAMMPDHVHLAVRGDVDVSPLQIGEEMREATCTAAGTGGFWMRTGYVGSFGAYGIGAVRAKQRERSRE